MVFDAASMMEQLWLSSEGRHVYPLNKICPHDFEKFCRQVIFVGCFSSFPGGGHPFSEVGW